MSEECKKAKKKVEELMVKNDFSETIWQKFLDANQKVKNEMAGMTIEQIRQAKKVLKGKIDELMKDSKCDLIGG
jgi:hypothetical protein